MKTTISLVALALSLAAAPAFAKAGDPVQVSDDLTIDPIIDANLRYEYVDQDNALKEADALTMRIRAGAEFKINGLSLLAEAAGNLAIIDDYNSTTNGKTGFSTVADPQNVALNRLSIGYASKAVSLTLGRQRVILDNARFVGNSGWRQNEQTFDAVRGTGKIGPVTLDATYAISQRTVFGVDSLNQHYDGNFLFLNGGIETKPVKIKTFAYLLDYDRPDRWTWSTQTFGASLAGTIPAGPTKLSYLLSYARQIDYRANPKDFDAGYVNGEIGLAYKTFAVKAGYEALGSDSGVAFFTPQATLHAFNGWADVFLSATPQTATYGGLQDVYGSLGKTFGDLGPLKGLNASVIYHQFDSDVGDKTYGAEWDASLGFTLRNTAFLVKYANYDANGYSVDTEKLWLQLTVKY